MQSLLPTAALCTHTTTPTYIGNSLLRATRVHLAKLTFLISQMAREANLGGEKKVSKGI